MVKGRFIWWIFAGVGLTVAMLAVSLGWTLSSEARDVLEAQARARLAERFELITSALAEQQAAGPLALDAAARLAAGLGEGSAVWVDPQPVDALRRAAVYRPNPTSGAPWVFQAREIEGLGTLRVGLPLTPAGTRLLDVPGVILRTSLAAGALCLVLGALVARRASRRFGQVARFVDQIGAAGPGSGGRRLTPAGPGELGALVGSLNRMASELERRERAVEREMVQRGAILASMADGVLAVDKEQRVVLINETAKELLPFVLGVPEGEYLWDVVRQTEVLELVSACVENLEQGRRRAVVFKGQDSLKRILELRASPLLRAPDGGCVLLIQDRTELERLERVRRDFVANVSHELKTPLTSVRGYLETVRDDPEMPPALRARFLEKSIRNADRLAAIISDLLTLARAEGGAEGAPREVLDLGSLARVVAADATTLATEGGIELVVEAPEVVSVQADRAALSSALVNLVENAIKYSPPATRVTVSVTRAAGSARFTVEDQGPGIPEKHLDRIFERFYRIAEDRSRELGGTGLGLAIVRHVALAHGGQVRVKSTLGHGSRFTLELPT